VEPFKLDGEGYLEIPGKPGLGIALDRDKVARYSPSADLLFKTP
jgi:L-alanine-DL-glutamate epimerase-like enolase superfamily enzyme